MYGRYGELLPAMSDYMAEASFGGEDEVEVEEDTQDISSWNEILESTDPVDDLWYDQERLEEERREEAFAWLDEGEPRF